MKKLQPVVATKEHPEEVEINRLKLIKRKTKCGYLRYDVYEKGKPELLGTCTVVCRGVEKKPILENFVSLSSRFQELINAANEIGIPIEV